MSDQFKTCILNGAETFKSPRYLKNAKPVNGESEINKNLNGDNQTKVEKYESENHDKSYLNGNANTCVKPRSVQYVPKKKVTNKAQQAKDASEWH